MTTSTMHPDNVLEALLAKGNRQDKNDKLRKLHKICSLEYSRHTEGARDLSLANISRLAESGGLFKARTIYNKQSSDYVELINSWEAYNGPQNISSLKSKTSSNEKYAFLQKIEDPSIRSLCHLAIIERDKLKLELNLLKSKTQIIVDMRPLGRNVVKESDSSTVIETATQLTDSERNALGNSIDQEKLDQRKWRVGSAGEILDERDRFVFDPGFVTAIKKVLGL